MGGKPEGKFYDRISENFSKNGLNNGSWKVPIDSSLHKRSYTVLLSSTSFTDVATEGKLTLSLVGV